MSDSSKAQTDEKGSRTELIADKESSHKKTEENAMQTPASGEGTKPNPKEKKPAEQSLSAKETEGNKSLEEDPAGGDRSVVTEDAGCEGQKKLRADDNTPIDALRIDIARTIRNYFPKLFWVTVGFAFCLIGLIVAGFVCQWTMATAVLAASVQVAFGMVIGFVCVYIGLMMTWFGIDAAYTIKGSMGTGDMKAEGALKSASPGLLFALGGMILIAVSLYKPIVYQKQGLTPAGSESFGDTGGGESPEKKLPPPPPIPGQNQS